MANCFVFKPIYLVSFLVVLLYTLISCNAKGQKEVISPTKIETTTLAQSGHFYVQQYQDSLRSVLLDAKSNAVLKSSVLQELYIRGLVDQVGQSIEFNLPFDLHGLDCGAPDCYSTDITFNIPVSQPLSFPKSIPFSLKEYGCIIGEQISIKDTFYLMESSPNYLNYYAQQMKGNLIILKDERSLYYFPNEDEALNINQVEGRLNQLEETIENTDQIPYQSSIMLQADYEGFFRNE